MTAARRAFCIASILLGLGGAMAFGEWQTQEIDSKADFRGLCVVNAKVAWVSGTQGTFARTTDGGKTWSVGTVPDAGKLDFRDVEAESDMSETPPSLGVQRNPFVPARAASPAGGISLGTLSCSKGHGYAQARYVGASAGKKGVNSGTCSWWRRSSSTPGRSAQR